MNTVTAICLSLYPWLFGACILYALLQKCDISKLELHAFILGTATYIGYVTTALILEGLNLLHINALSSWFWFASFVFWLLCFLLGKTKISFSMNSKNISQQPQKNHDTQNQPRLSLVNFALLILLSLVVLATLHQTALQPATGWDTLSFWAAHGHDFLKTNLETNVVQIMSAETHPRAVKYIGMWGAFSINNRADAWLYLPWATVYIGLILTSVSLGKLLSGSWTIGITGGLLLASTPVLESHASIGGYAEIWVSASVFFSLSWIAAIYSRWFQLATMPILICVAIIVSLALLKGNSFVYAAIIVFSIIVTITWTRFGFLGLIMLFGSLGISLAFILIEGINLNFGEYRLFFDPSSETMVLGQRPSYIASNSWAQIFANMINALFVNSSYSLLGLLGLGLSIFGLVNRPTRSCQFFLTLTCTLTLLVMFFLLGQHLSGRHLFTYSMPNNDTSLSRFMQLIIPVIALLWSSVLIGWNGKDSSDHSCLANWARTN